MFSNNALHECETDIRARDKETELELADAGGLLSEQMTDPNSSRETGRLKDDSKDEKSCCRGERTEDDKVFQKECKLQYEGTKKLKNLPKEIGRTMQDTPNTSDSAAKVTLEKKMDVSDNENNIYENGADEESEPRYTVAQLISAFNRHQEVVTKTSLEVTMTTSDKETKIPSIILNSGNSKFPTGANALRLFIPDIDITNEPPKRKQKRKYSLGSGVTKEREQNAETYQVSKATVEPSKDLYQTEDDEAFQSLESSSSLTTNDYDSITSVLIPEETVDEKQDGQLEQEITSASKQATTEDSVNENIDSTNNNHNDDSSTICTLVVEPPTADRVPNAEQEQSLHTVNVNKFQLSVDVTPNYLRSGSLSSDASATSSEGSGSMSWEELTPPGTATPSSTKHEPQQWPQKAAATSPGRRHTSRSRSPSVNRDSWGRICTGTYNRAMEKLVNKQENTGASGPSRRPNRKSLTLLSPPHVISPSEKIRRKSIPVIKHFS
ncbi:hypothetical protein L798_01911 [Zootermopsis nevadensis]|uniref:Uncharacterized protein n=2 Tax=Zootermopsis nevadensis TaxID=136037 RepID=A0A067QK60_ZOONE|nr:hypothetical protein L798_01911 [Zootermopsis nevadensis]